MPGRMETTGKYVLGTYVGILYLVFVCLLFGGFAAYISRVNLGRDLAADVGSLDTVIFRGTREAALNERLAAVRAERLAVSQHLREVELKRIEVDGALYSETTRQLELFLPISTTVSTNAGLLTPVFVNDFHDVYRRTDLHPRDKAEQLTSILSTVTFAEDADAEKKDAFTRELVKVLSGLADKREVLTNLGISYDRTSQEIDILNRDGKALDAEIAQIEAQIAEAHGLLTDEHRALIASFKNSLAGIPYALIQIPTIILTLIVTVAAGGLGSIVAFTRAFWRGHENTGSGRLLVNTGEGVAAAIAIFLFAGAGMLMLTQGGSGSAQQAELSPYMVAFIAFVSGFMADDAFTRIQEAGRDLFKGKTGGGNGGGGAGGGGNGGNAGVPGGQPPG